MSVDDSVYRPFESKRSIRLLQFAARTDLPNGFELRLETFPFDDAPSYYALSYTWGSAKFEEDWEDALSPVYVPVICDGQPMQVGRNLADFFLQVVGLGMFDAEADGSSENPEAELYLWVDAICINQEDVNERSHQVLLMGDIYRAAQKVIVWLGKEEPHPDVLWMLDKFVPAFDEFYKVVGLEFFWDKSWADPLYRSQIGAEIWDKWTTTHIDFFNFLNRLRWFTRGWVIQEVVLKAPSSIWMQCGKTRLSWERTSDFFFLLKQVMWISQINQSLAKSLPSWRVSQGRMSRMLFVLTQYNSFVWKRDSWNRTQLLKRTGYFWGAKTDEHARWCQVFETVQALRMYNFGDKKDHIYGCLGLAKQMLQPEYTLPIEPDYNLSVEEVFTRFMALMLQKMPVLDMLGNFEASRKRLKTLPSWVPDFSAYNSGRRIRERSLRLNFESTFDATLTRYSPQHSVHVDGRKLLLEGLKLDTISEKGSVASGSTFGGPDWWFLNFCQRCDRYKPTSEPSAEAVLKTFAADALPKDLTKEEMREIYLNYMAETLAAERPSSKYPKFANRLDTLLQRLQSSSSSGHLPTMQEVQNAAAAIDGDDHGFKGPLYEIIDIMSVPRRLFSTKRNYLGLALRGTFEPGDQVWLLNGARTPFILRKKRHGRTIRNAVASPEFELVGETYLHGFMYGETLTDEVRRSFTPVTIV